MVTHLGFVLFVLLGGLLVLRWRRLAPVHLACAAYGVAIEIGGWVCPLTPLENALRRRAGAAGYTGGFVEHYLLPVLYPSPFPRWMPWVLATLIVAVNTALYGRLLSRHRAPSGVDRAKRHLGR